MASEYTPAYNLDLYTSADKPNLRDQYNAAMRKIDTAMQTLNNTIGGWSGSLTAIQKEVQSVNTEYKELKSKLATYDSEIAKIEELETTASTITGQVSNILQRFPVSISDGGTGANTATQARANLGFTLANLGITQTAATINGLPSSVSANSAAANRIESELHTLANDFKLTAEDDTTLRALTGANPYGLTGTFDGTVESGGVIVAHNPSWSLFKCYGSFIINAPAHSSERRVGVKVGNIVPGSLDFSIYSAGFGFLETTGKSGGNFLWGHLNVWLRATPQGIVLATDAFTSTETDRIHIVMPNCLCFGTDLGDDVFNS